MIANITRPYLWLVAVAGLVSLTAGIAVGAASWSTPTHEGELL